MSPDNDFQLIPSTEKHERNWLPIAIAAFVVIAIAVIFTLALRRDSNQTTVQPINAPLDAYAANLQISGLAMSESTNFVGNKITYIDGRITNTGNRIVTGMTVQTLFYDYSKEVAQNVTQPLKLIRTRQPYIDVEPVSANPIKPGESREFRLIFDGVSPDWNEAYPQLRILHVDFQ